jgi:predicted outer membrane repeat protein
MHARAGALATVRTVVAILTVAVPLPRPVHAEAVVGTGAASGCTEAALDAALAGGGNVTFNCGASPVTITVTSQKTVAADTTIDGGGLIALSGGAVTRVVVVNSGATLTLANLTISDGASGASSFGGAIENDGMLNVTNSTFANNTAGNDGGAIRNKGAANKRAAEPQRTQGEP